jgi:quinol monooxygenase YgiN
VKKLQLDEASLLFTTNVACFDIYLPFFFVVFCFLLLHHPPPQKKLPKFLRIIENNAKCSRKEKGCHRFDVLRHPSKSSHFIFYEVYENKEAVEFHKSTDHYKVLYVRQYRGHGAMYFCNFFLFFFSVCHKAWADFKAEGVVSAVSSVNDVLFYSEI